MRSKQAIEGFFAGQGEQTPVAPLAFFRMAFGLMMFAALVRFTAKGWIETLFIEPRFFFTYYGFEWVTPLSSVGMYVVFGLMMLCALMIAVGLLYRYSAVIFFVLFTYVELIDKSNYLNHYYFISIMAGLMCLLPANKKYALDNWLNITTSSDTVPRWTILALQLQMAVVYFFAGISKINPDWLLQAMPLKLWLAAKYDTPVIGAILNETWLAYAFSWCGMLFDVTIAFFLFNRKTVWYAYAVVVVFHILTAILFPGIGMFPFIMIVCATVFLPAVFHEKVLSFIPSAFFLHRGGLTHGATPVKFQRTILAVLAIHFAIQIFLPLRYALYPGSLFYTEEGYRFSWRVMLMEKAGYVVFTVKDAATGEIREINNGNYLTPQQEKQMSTQPDMIADFGRYLGRAYCSQFAKPEVYAEAYVTVNGRHNCLLIDPKQNLAITPDNLLHKKWIIARAE